MSSATSPATSSTASSSPAPPPTWRKPAGPTSPPGPKRTVTNWSNPARTAASSCSTSGRLPASDPDGHPPLGHRSGRGPGRWRKSAGLAIAQLLPPFPGVPWGRHLLAVPLIALGATVAVAGYLEWRRNQRALHHGQPLPRSPLPRILAASITVMAIIAGVLILLSTTLK